jgi:antibiotic biosynthesis monooxygenase (ABM) superfamily enzyme
MKALFNRLRYPKTDAGRRRYVQDNLNPKPKGKLIFCLIIIAGLAGMLALLVWMIRDKYGKASFLLIVLLSIAAMVTLLIGVEGLRLWKERQES